MLGYFPSPGDACAHTRGTVATASLSRKDSIMNAVNDTPSPVRLKAVAAPGQPELSPALETLYRGFERELLVPLWTEIGDLMPLHPRSRAVPHVWRWQNLLELADQAGHLVPVGRGG